MAAISDLSFLSGAWSGDGFVMNFSEPAQSMMFGSMQAGNKEGKTTYWKTFRFEMADELLLYTVTMNRDSGTYVLSKQEPSILEFFGLRNVDPKFQYLYFECSESGKELKMGIRGVVNGETYKHEWNVRSVR
jgi:hypothetical protein